MSTTKAQAEVWDEDEVNPVGDRWDTVEGLSEGAYINITQMIHYDCIKYYHFISVNGVVKYINQFRK